MSISVLIRDPSDAPRGGHGQSTAAAQRREPRAAGAARAALQHQQVAVHRLAKGQGRRERQGHRGQRGQGLRPLAPGRQRREPRLGRDEGPKAPLPDAKDLVAAAHGAVALDDLAAEVAAQRRGLHRGAAGHTLRHGAHDLDDVEEVQAHGAGPHPRDAQTTIFVRMPHYVMYLLR